MQEVKHDGTSGDLEMLIPGLEWAQIAKALTDPSVAFVRVRSVILPKGYKLKKKKKRKAARKQRKHNRGR